MEDSLASVDDLRVTFRRRQEVRALAGVSLELRRGEILGLVGESGSGKTVLGLTLLGLLPARPAPRVSGAAWVCGTDMASASEAARREVRKRDLGAVFQDPMSSLNPTMRVGRQITEASGTDGSERDAAELLDRVGLGQAKDRLRSYPHEFSGGQRQRLMLAMAIARNPALVIADEPTTALDVTIQRQILDLIRELRDDVGCSFLFITHDLAVASEVADRVAVLYSGRLAELGTAEEVLSRPRHPYTLSLLKSRLSLSVDTTRPLPTIAGSVPAPGEYPPGCQFAPRCPLREDACTLAPPPLEPVTGRETASRHETACLRQDAIDQLEHLLGRDALPTWGEVATTADGFAVSVRGVSKTFTSRRRVTEPVRALHGIDLDTAPGECVALVGESGSGKSTLLRVIAGLIRPDAGTVTLGGGGDAQMIFQDAGQSLTPWLRVGELIEERLKARGADTRQARRQVLETVRLVGLPAEVVDAKPHQLSGGQAQRVAIARAVAVPPRVLLADEPTSSLDVSLAATVLNLLGRLRRELSLSMVFVTHDLAAARIVADRIVVMRQGEVVEEGTADDVIARSSHAYTRALVAAVPGRALADPGARGLTP
ncbi:MAG TPA: ABC transporter ATP-binding protein [Actinomycetes bacterium]|nr:ABC transporter ATP-binding protein [Actinomycetes bacterium]